MIFEWFRKRLCDKKYLFTDEYGHAYYIYWSWFNGFTIVCERAVQERAPDRQETSDE